MIISEKTISLIDTINEKANTICGYQSNQIKKDFNYLITNNYVEVGYRLSCGSTDKTHKVFKEWLKVINILRKNNIIIIEENVKHDNKSPNMAGGFWNSIIYKIPSNEQIQP